MNSVSLTQVNKRFINGVQALHNVSVDFEAGSFNAIIGPSGAGKSTMLRMINGLDFPSSGEVKIEKTTLTKKNIRTIRGNIGIIFQHYNLVSRLSVMSNALSGRLRYRSLLGSLFYLFRKDDLEIASHTLERVGLLDRAWERSDRLSGGQQQRVGIARALAQKPHILLADEPISSLDPVSSEEIMQLLREICDKDKITVVVNLHQVDFAQRFADRLIGLNRGRIVFDGTPATLDQRALDSIYYKPQKETQRETPRFMLANA